MKNKKNMILKYVLGIVLLGLVLYFVDIGCIFRLFFGVSCPGCGLTRAYRALLKLDLKSAFHFHPLFWTIPIIIFLYYKKVSDTALVPLIIIFIVVYLIRLFNGADDIVTIDITNGLIYKMLFGIINKIV